MDIKVLQSRLAKLGFYSGAIDGIMGPKTYAGIMAAMVKRGPSELVLKLGAGCAQYLPKYGLTSRLKIAHFLAQGAAETGGFQFLEENLNYSSKRLTQVWPNRFPNLTAAAPYAHNPEALANKTYGGRMGNTAPGDGWSYRGRGFKMLTGKDNYRKFGQLTKMNLLNEPWLAADPVKSIHIACEYWKANEIGTWAEQDNLQVVTKKINGGLIGFDLRSMYLKKAKEIL